MNSWVEISGYFFMPSKTIFFSFSLTSALPLNNKIKQTWLPFGTDEWQRQIGVHFK